MARATTSRSGEREGRGRGKPAPAEGGGAAEGRSPARGRSAGIVVMGPFRSGTSLVAQILGLLGADLGPPEELYEPTRYNPDGYFQRPDVSLANTRFIESAGGSLRDPGDPRLLLERGDPGPLRSLRLDWREAAPSWCLKDPRFCATLWSWVRLGLIRRDGLRIVRVRRGIEDTARSAVQHYDVKVYCGGTLDGARAMLRRYDELADWQLAELSVPAHGVGYEDLIADPAAVIGALAAFVGAADPERVAACVQLVGKRKALLRYYLKRLVGAGSIQG